ncbi:hypothetical protein K1X80_16600 [Pseudomonas sp. So3.2b]|uniref:hypothetical protein n=1 Tax=Pseudomonas sp. So3.2b TaxID=2864101 RepID=UPI001C6940D2|nr:hypothetical protein [Pseudomonas sp. So3.2b]QYM66676.1 hypothetical protein K1X80_16600 [Pseudomonas sp. So3.2b]
MYEFPTTQTPIFNAMTVGIQPTATLGRKLSVIAMEKHVHLSDDGELSVACDEAEAPFYLTQLIDAAAAISYHCSQWEVASESRFEQLISAALRKTFPGKVKRYYSITGASGHQFKLPFAIDVDKAEIQVVQTISTVGDAPYWSSVYQALGKMIDVKNAISGIRRTVIF